MMYRLVKICVCVVLVSTMTACGTIATLSSADGEIKRTMRDRGSHCSALPRVFSGCSYVACLIGSAESSGPIEDGILYTWNDLPTSCLADLLVLPFTIYRQNRYGSIPLR